VSASRKAIHKIVQHLPSGPHDREREAKEKAMNPTENRSQIANEELRRHGIFLTVAELKLYVFTMRLAIKNNDPEAFGKAACQIAREALKVDAQPS
jgi:hypothetical protein